MGRLTIMGSGELAPGMVRVHRSALAEYDQPNLVVLDSPYGFQENADELTDKLVDFFRTSLVLTPSVASLRAPDTGVIAARARTAVSEADVVFSGPGSPSYALRVWRDSGMTQTIRTVAARGSLTFASAAACTLGRWAIPVYEIYKVGQDPFWHEGLDAVRLAGLPTVVVPHFDNREGGTHDTSHCYIGQRRFDRLRQSLPPHVVIGVDEHTAAAFDFAAGTIEVTGRGSVHLIGEEHRRLDPGIHRLEALEPAEPPATVEATAPSSDTDSLLAEVVAATGPGAGERAAVALAELAVDGGTDRRDVVAPFVEILLELRSQLRSDGRYGDADAIRDGLAESGIVVRDTSEGAEWDLDQRIDRPSA